MGTGGSFPGDKACRAVKLTTPSSAEVKECVKLLLYSPIRRHGAVLSYAQGQLFYLRNILLSLELKRNSVSLY